MGSSCCFSGRHDRPPLEQRLDVYLAGAKSWKHEKNGLTDASAVQIDLEEKDGRIVLKTNLYDIMNGFTDRMIRTDILGKAFEPEQFLRILTGHPSPSIRTTSEPIVRQRCFPAPLRRSLQSICCNFFLTLLNYPRDCLLIPGIIFFRTVIEKAPFHLKGAFSSSAATIASQEAARCFAGNLLKGFGKS